MTDFELLPHMADMKLRVYGKDLSALFAHAVIGMFQSIRPHVPDCEVVHGRVVCKELPISREVDLTASQVSLLLVDFLSQALYLSDVYNEAYFDVQIHEISPTHISATLQGVAIKGFESVEIKAVTYHDLVVEAVADGWQAEIVFDI